MSKPAISVENLSKAYRIGLKEEIPDTLVGALTSVAKSPFKNFNRLRRLDTFSDQNNQEAVSDDTLWALKDVSFDVQEGEVVGIIGRNGAGKSTLLKVLSRITEPTSGRVTIRGRVSSLLEVGTGFHPELTGRENIYMNGTILGMTKREIDRKFDEIVDFSGVEKFLDTPVKRYSSGMSVRLAFAVAAHLEPEILIIDEVLAVGDAEFQKKCLGKMQDVSSQGRTILFVSHNMVAVQNLCHRSIMLHSGGVKLIDKTSIILQKYRDAVDRIASSCDLSHPSIFRKGSGALTITLVQVETLDGTPISTVSMGQGFKIILKILANSEVSQFAAAIGLFDSIGNRICGLNSNDLDHQFSSVSKSQEVQVECKIPECNLMPGRYYFSFMIRSLPDMQILDHVIEAVAIEILESDVFGTSRIPVQPALIFFKPEWLSL